ncbi:MAG TPA: hypothetical protein VF062_26580 [Candidatus Limnocylindrales bacterium]
MAIELDPVRGVDAARGLADAAQRIVHVRDTVGADIETANQAKPWGGGDLGDTFAQTYSGAASRLLDVWRAAAQRTLQLGDEIETAVEAMVATDEAAAARVGGAGSGGSMGV